MKLKSITRQKDIYDIDFVTGQIKVTKPDGKVWYMPISDVRMIAYVMKTQETIESLKGDIKYLNTVIEL